MNPIRKLLTRFFKPFFIVRVSGESGWPALVPGRRYLASGLFRPRLGDFAVARDPKCENRILVKKVCGIAPQGYRLKSAVSWGSSSDDFGLIPRSLVIGKIIRFPS